MSSLTIISTECEPADKSEKAPVDLIPVFASTGEQTVHDFVTAHREAGEFVASATALLRRMQPYAEGHGDQQNLRESGLSAHLPALLVALRKLREQSREVEAIVSRFNALPQDQPIAP